MSWEIALSKYKRSLFTNDLALKTIIFIDRNGISTEDEILKTLKVSKEKLNSCIHDLKLNDIIEYEEDFIRLTTVGCKIIDRFDFSDLILDDIVFGIETENNRKNELKTILKFYRDESPYCYHNTNYSLRIWLSIVRDITENKEFEINKDEELGTYKSIIYRDIRNWISHSPSKSKIKDSLNKELSLLLFTRKPDIKDCVSMYDFSHNYSISYLTIIDDFLIADDSLKKFDAKLSSMYEKFYTAQCVNMPNKWFELGFSLKNNLPSIKKYTYLKNYISKLETNIINNISTEMIDNSSFKNRLLYSRNWLEKSDDVLECLFISNSLNEFCKNSNWDMFKAVETISQIKDKCNELLNNE